jgi:hypothetical protein
MAEDLIQMLDEQGQLETVRDDIRSKVQDVLHQRAQAPVHMPACMSTETGRVVAELFRDFLRCNGLVSTLHVFEPESQLSRQSDQTKEVAGKLGLSVQRGEPLVYQLVDPLVKAKSKPSASKAPLQILRPDLKLPENMQTESPDVISSLSSQEHLAGALRPRSKQLPSLAVASQADKKDKFKDEISNILTSAQKFSPYNDFDEEIDEHFDEDPATAIKAAASNGSSSLGADVSVDSLMMEEYDHIEEVRRLSRSQVRTSKQR